MEMRNADRSGPHLRTDRCEFCGASPRQVRFSIGEMAANAACGILLLTVLTLAGYFVDRWLERNGRDFIDSLIWHEPLESWSL